MQLGLGERIEVCILLLRDGQIQANDQDIVLATPVWVFLGKEIFTASLFIDIQVSYSALDREYLVSSSRVCMRRICPLSTSVHLTECCNPLRLSTIVFFHDVGNITPRQDVG